ncbi:hypothetical protein [Variovorax gossypii]|jgi:hypothetical protein
MTAPVAFCFSALWALLGMGASVLADGDPVLTLCSASALIPTVVFFWAGIRAFRLLRAANTPECASE